MTAKHVSGLGACVRVDGRIRKFAALAGVALTGLAPSPGWALPSTYDLRTAGAYSYVTPVKDQGSYGTCWAFAATGAMESSALRRGLLTSPASPSADWSEAHLARFYGNHDTGIALGAGGRDDCLGYYARGRGPVLDSDYPYPGNTGDPVGNYPRQCWLAGQKRLDSSDARHPAGRDDLKNAILNHGAVVTAMYWQDASYNSGNYTYYYSGASVSNHDVDLVGWDDTKATAGGAGAWLVKNSWGTSFGDGGYFWLSYNDGVAARSSAAYLTASNAAYSDIHQNQTDAAGSWWSFSDGAARFSTTTSERLKAVGFQVRDYGAQYTLGVYSTWSGDAPSGLLATKTGTLDWPGYYLIDLAAPVVLENNDDFVVTLNLPSVGGSGNRVAVDANSGDPAGVTYYSTNGVTWTDMQGLSGNNILFLKALALAYLAGDCDRNDKVEFTDYQLLESGFGAATGATWAMGDFDANGTVNFTDYQLLEANFGQGIPEPATAGLLLAGLALAARRRG